MCHVPPFIFCLVAESFCEKEEEGPHKQRFCAVRPFPRAALPPLRAATRHRSRRFDAAPIGRFYYQRPVVSYGFSLRFRQWVKLDGLRFCVLRNFGNKTNCVTEDKTN